MIEPLPLTSMQFKIGVTWFCGDAVPPVAAESMTAVAPSTTTAHLRPRSPGVRLARDVARPEIDRELDVLIPGSVSAGNGLA